MKINMAREKVEIKKEEKKIAFLLIKEGHCWLPIVNYVRSIYERSKCGLNNKL
jgi:hypothetical protein